MPASQLAEKEQELNVFMEKALVDRRQLAEKYKEARDKLKQLEQHPSVVSCRSQRCLLNGVSIQPQNRDLMARLPLQ